MTFCCSLWLGSLGSCPNQRGHAANVPVRCLGDLQDEAPPAPCSNARTPGQAPPRRLPASSGDRSTAGGWRPPSPLPHQGILCGGRHFRRQVSSQRLCRLLTLHSAEGLLCHCLPLRHSRAAGAARVLPWAAQCTTPSARAGPAAAAPLRQLPRCASAQQSKGPLRRNPLLLLLLCRGQPCPCLEKLHTDEYDQLSASDSETMPQSEGGKAAARRAGLGGTAATPASDPQVC